MVLPRECGRRSAAVLLPKWAGTGLTGRPTSNATRRLPTRTSPIRGRNLLLDVKQLDANTTFQPSLTQFGQTRLGCRRGKTSIKRPQIRERYRDTDTRSRARLSRCQPRSLGRLSPSRCPRPPQKPLHRRMAPSAFLTAFLRALRWYGPRGT